MRNGRMTEGSKCYVQVSEFAEAGNGLLFASTGENLTLIVLMWRIG